MRPSAFLIVRSFIAVAMTPLAFGSDTCGAVSEQTLRLRAEVSDLKSEYPITYGIVCRAVGSIDENDSAGDVIATILLNYAACTAVISTNECDYVIEKVRVLADKFGSVAKYAKEFNCPAVPRPNPC